MSVESIVTISSLLLKLNENPSSTCSEIQQGCHSIKAPVPAGSVVVVKKPQRVYARIMKFMARIYTLNKKEYSPEQAAIIRLSGPLKERYALEHNLDYQKLLDASEYKELHRQKMIKWGEDIRNSDPGYFCRHAILQSSASSKKIWIVSDARRKSDIEFFQSHFPDVTHTIRIYASEEVRKQRGFIFTQGIDDVESECGLDDYTEWNFQLHNNSEAELLEEVSHLLQSLNVNLSNSNQ